jgi:proline iminopeptidase
MTDQFSFETLDDSDEPDEAEPEGYPGERSLDDPFDEGYAPQEHWPAADEPDAAVDDQAALTAFVQRLDSEEPEVEDDWDEDAPAATHQAVPAPPASLDPVLYPPIEPYAQGHLDVGDGQQIYWEECGSPGGKPVVFLHGGPGGGCTPEMRRLFDPTRYRIVLFDQRGCGRSRPHAREPEADLRLNTTWHLVADIERLREQRAIDRWQVFGGSWGSALALAYAEKHPQRVTELVLRGVFTLRRAELDWYYNGGAAMIAPERYEGFLAPLGGSGFTGDAIAAYARLLSDPDPAVHQPAAVAWSTWEASTLTLVEDEQLVSAFRDPAYALAFARIENHYFVHGGWFEEGQLIARAGRLKDIPGVIVQGRYDLATPPVTAWDLHRAWPEAKLMMVPAAGHAFSEPGIGRALVSATDRFAP